MRKTTLVGLGVAMMAAQSAQAQGWQWLPVNDPGFEAKPAVSVMAGQMTTEINDSDTGDILGIELSMNCILLQPPSNRIRQQLSATWFDEAGMEMANLEINPHYVVEVAPNLEVGGGPGLGIILVNTDAEDPTYLAAQVGASVHYTGWPVFVGAEWRYQVTTEEELVAGATKEDINNSRFAIKLGYAF